MWVIIEFIVIAAIVLIFITEFLYPLLTQKPLFGSFRKKASPEKKTHSSGPLDEKIAEAKDKVKDVKKIQDEVDEHFESAKDLKNESDDLLK